MIVRNNIKEYRLKRKLSYRKLAKLINRSPRAVLGWERGEWQCPPLIHKSLASILEVKETDLFYLE